MAEGESERVTTLGAWFKTIDSIEQHVMFVGCDERTPVAELRTDSRHVRPGDAFIALQGETRDAHAFVPAAFAAGAAVAIVEHGRTLPPDGPHVWLRDTNDALPELAANAHGRPGEHLALAGVTGTNGKTTTAHLVGSLLAQGGIPYARLGTTGNWIIDHEERASFTTPFPVELQELLGRARTRGARAAVMETSSHALRQGRLKPLRFVAAGLTSFTQDHLDFHRDMDDYLAAKLLLVQEHLAPGAVAVAAVDGHPAAAVFLRAAAEHGATTWRASRGADPSAELLATDLELGAEGSKATIHTPFGVIRLRSPLLAGFNVDNILVATGLALGLHVPIADIERALSQARGAPGRLQRVEVDGVSGPSVIVDYAHTPDAVERAIAAVRPLCSGRLSVVLGCGGDRDPGKRPLMGGIAARDSDRCFATSDNPRTEDPMAILAQMMAGVDDRDRPHVTVEPDRATAIAIAIAEAGPRDLVLIAGKGHETSQQIGSQVFPFDDREHARAALRARHETR